MTDKLAGHILQDAHLDSKEKGTDSVRAVHRALDLLTAFSRENFELTAGQLLQLVDLSRPTLYRLLYTLEQKGFILSSGDPQRFRLGPAVAKLSHVWTDTLDVAALAEPALKSLWDQTKETVAIFVAQDDMRLCLAELPSPQPLSFRRGVGYSERIALGASGRAILAFTGDAEARIDELLKGLKLDRKTFLSQLVDARHRGFAVSKSELIGGAVAVAAPFYSGSGVAGSVGVFGPAARLDDRAVEKLGKLVTGTAGQISTALGVEAYLPPSAASSPPEEPARRRRVAK